MTNLSFLLILFLSFFLRMITGEWLNHFVEQLTPRISTFVKDALISSAGKGQYNYSFARNLSRYHGIHFSTLNLTEMTLKVTDICALDPILDPDSAILDFTFGYSGICDIQFQFKVFNININRISASGRIRQVVTPLIDRPPFFGGVQFSMLERPKIDFEFSSSSKINVIPGIKSLLLNFLTNIVMDGLGYPAKLPLQYDPTVDIKEIKSNTRTGVFAFRILSASNLPYPPVMLMGATRPDVSVIAKLGTFKFQTNPSSSDDPVWEDKWYSIAMETYAGHKMTFEVTEVGHVVNHLNSRAQIDISSYINHNSTIDLESVVEGSKKNVTAQLNVVLFWIPLKDAAGQNESLNQILSTWKPVYPGQSQILLTIFIYRLKILKIGGDSNFLPKLDETENFFLIVQVGNKTTTGKALANQRSVKVEQELFYLLDQGWEEQQFSIQITYSRGFSGYLGTVRVGTPYQSKLRSFENENWKKSFLRILPGTNRTVTMATRIQYLDSNFTLSNFGEKEVTLISDRTKQQTKEGV